MKSIVSKFLVSSFFFTALVAGGFWYFGKLDSLSLIFAGILIVYIAAVLFYIVVMPMKSVLLQMQLMLAGRKFKKIYTKRVDEIGIMAHFFNQVTSGFTKVASDIEDRNRILDELKMAAEIQKNLVPKDPPQFDDLIFEAKIRPASELGGDSYNFIDTKDKIYIYLGDVTGHGTTAALIMAMISSIIGIFSGTLASARDIIVATNSALRKYVKSSMYMTLVMLCYDKNAKKMTYVGAGHEHILIYRKDSGQIDDIVSGGTALGMIDDVSKTALEKELMLNKGDMIVLYTDGITEARNSSQELYGLERLKQSLFEYGQTYSATGVAHHISEDLAAFVGDESQLDDITLLVIEKK